MTSDRVSRRKFVGGLTVASAAGLAGCGGFGGGNGDGEPTDDEAGGDATSPTEEETEEPETQASVQVRAVHAVVGGPEVDVYVDDEPAFEAVAYADVSDYTEVQTEGAQVRVTAAGDENQVLYEDELDVDEEGTFSVVAYGDAGGAFAGDDEATPTEEGSTNDENGTATGTPGGEETPTDEEDMQQNETGGEENESAAGQDGNATQENGTATGTPSDDDPSRGGIQIAVLEDDAAEVEGEDAAVRVFHASPDAPEVDVAVAGESDPFVSGVAYGEASDYETVASGNQSLEVRSAGEEDAVAEFEAEFEAGRGHTGYAVGYLESDDPEAETAFDLIGVVDGTAEAAAGQTAQSGTGNETSAGNETSMGNESAAGNESSMENDSGTNESAPENDSSAGTGNETSTA